MNLSYTAAEAAFRDEARAWLTENLAGEFADIRFRGGPGDEHSLIDKRLAWERHLGRAGWIGLGWPTDVGGRGATLNEQVIWNEEYARAGGPGRIGHIGETLAGPTIIAFGSTEQKARFLPAILAGDELWCQGYSEPNAGSDLANVQTKAVLEGEKWVIEGQKVWTSMAEMADWCFCLCRTDKAAAKHRGISYLLVPMNQPQIEIRPIVQMTGTSEFAEVFFDGATTDKSNVVGDVNGGWRVAMGTLSFERGVSTLGQQLSFQNEFDEIVRIAKENGASKDPILRHRLADAWIGLRVMRFNALRMLSGQQAGTLNREGLLSKIYWATWHRDLGKLAMDVLGAASEIAISGPRTDGAVCNLTALQRLFLFTRSDTIYAGSNQIQRNIIGERALGLPKEPKVR